MKNRLLSVMLLVLALGACRDPLSVPNLDDPDRRRVFSNPVDLEVFIAGLWAVQHQATIGGSNDGLQTQMAVMSLENTSALANFAMGPRGVIPRNPITNQRGSQGNAGNLHDWFRGHRAARQAALGIAALRNLPLTTPAQTRRALMFARFIQGVALGNLSLAYDSASILTEDDNPEADAAVVVPLSHYSAVNAAALRYIDSALAIATAEPTSGGAFPFPNTANFWINGVTGLTGTGTASKDLFIRILRSYKAKIRAGVARTPTERAAVDWAQVILDADAGITADLAPQMDQTKAIDISWLAQHYASAAWHQMPQFFLLMADTSGSYATYLNTPNASRAAMLIVTPDRRFPAGVTRTAQSDTNTNTYAKSAGQNFALTPYFKNRLSGNDLAGEPLLVSQYDYYRSRQLQQASRIGPWPVMTAAEIRLLAAEGYFRTGDFAQMINRINVSRRDTVGGLIAGPGFLPAIPNTITDTLTPVPGTLTSCVPKVPDPNHALGAYKGYKCGNVWDALKYEYRLETAYTGYGNWYFAGRGWGDLPAGTATQFPVPYQEMDSRQRPFYGFGGGLPSSAGPGNYGLFPGGVY
jgi:hypothetical protein